MPATEAPAKYAWLGAHEIPTELPSGVVAMGVRSYVPQLGRFLQTDPVPGGSVNAYAYTYGDPVNSTDLSGAVSSPSQSLIKGMAQIANGSVEEQAAENAAAAAEAARKAEEAEELFALASGSYGEEWGEEEWWEEEGGEEYISYHYDNQAEHPPAHAEEVQLVQPLSAEGQRGDGVAVTVLPLCKAGAEGPCTRNVCFSGTGYNGHKDECRVGRKIRVRSPGAHRVRGRGQVRYEHGEEGCAVGAVGGAIFAGFSTVGLEAPTGAIAGCAIGAGIVELFEL